MSAPAPMPIMHLRKWYEILDPIRGSLTETASQMPAIIVIGNENCGKSSLLNAIIGMEILPNQEGICTRVPIEIRLRCSKSGSRSLKVTAYENGMMKGAVNGTITVEALAELLKRSNDQMGDSISDKNKVLIEIEEPGIPSLDIVDLPGMMQVARANFDPNTPAQTKELTRRYLQTHKNDALVLMVADSSYAPNNTLGAALVREMNFEDRAIGVLTRCDRLNDEALSETVPYLSNDPRAACIPLNHGYFATVLKLNKEKISRDEERNWFLDQKAHIFSRCPHKVGVLNLVGALERMMDEFLVRTWLPGTLRQLEMLQSEYKTEYLDLGVPMSQHVVGKELVSDDRLFKNDTVIIDAIDQCLKQIFAACMTNLKSSIIRRISGAPDVFDKSPLEAVLKMKDAKDVFAALSLFSEQRMGPQNQPANLHTTLDQFFDGATTDLFTSFTEKLNAEHSQSNFKVMRFADSYIKDVKDIIQASLSESKKGFVQRLEEMIRSYPVSSPTMGSTDLVLKKHSEIIIDCYFAALGKAFPKGQFPKSSKIEETVSCNEKRRECVQKFVLCCEVSHQLIAKKEESMRVNGL